MTWHQWHHTASRSSRTKRFSRRACSKRAGLHARHALGCASIAKVRRGASMPLMLRRPHALGYLRHVTSPVGASRPAMPIVAIALAALLSGPPLSDPQLERAIEQAQRTPAIADRIEQLSRLFLGTAYGQFPLGEGSGIEPQPRWRADIVDCQTYVETVFASPHPASPPD